MCSAVTPWLSGQWGPPWKAETAEGRVPVPLCVTSGPVWVQRSAFWKLALFKEFLGEECDGSAQLKDPQLHSAPQPTFSLLAVQRAFSGPP